jgi:hypothetical protein
VRASEWIALTYFAYLAVAAALASGLAARRRLRVIVESVASGAVVVVVAAWSGDARSAAAWASPLRDAVLPLVYLLWCYWIPAHFRTDITCSAERLLIDLDREWAVPIVSASAAWPRVWIEVLEVAYLFCYPMLPAGYAVIVLWNSDAAIDRYWTALFVAAAVSYGVLPWVRTRPPRELEGPPPHATVVRWLNEIVLHHGSVQLNTIPSGHVATAVAAALAVSIEVPAAGVFFVLLALAIAVACVVRRYHYLADVVLGAVAGVVGVIVSRFV